MAAPVLVRAYAGIRPNSSTNRRAGVQDAEALPPISSFAFADILRFADSAEFQHAIDGIAEICAKNRMSLADEYASHLPPLGEITASSAAVISPRHLLRPGMRRALTSVPEASSGSSEGSRKSKRRTNGLFGFRRRQTAQEPPLREMRIGSIGRKFPVAGVTAAAVTSSGESLKGIECEQGSVLDGGPVQQRDPRERRPSAAMVSLQRLLDRHQGVGAE